MSKADGIALVKQVRQELTDFWDKVSDVYSNDDVIFELMSRRKYTDERMYNTLKEVKLTYFDTLSDVTCLFPLSQYKTAEHWGLTSPKGASLLSGRYIVPIRDINNKITALVGWFPDERKYITTPTFGFSRDAQFFNIETYGTLADKVDRVYLVEGIFDTLSLRSLGLFALGNMGLALSPIKVEILKRFGHVYAMPDGDNAGRGVLPFSGNGSKFKWNINNDVSFCKLGLQDVKDPDDFVKTYDCDDYLKNLGNSYIYNIT
jgi:hypothetical protein